MLGTQWRKPWWRILGVIVKREANVRECIITIFEVITTTTQQPVDKAHRQYGATQPQVLAIFFLSQVGLLKFGLIPIYPSSKLIVRCLSKIKESKQTN